jgi:hypothetical protein
VLQCNEWCVTLVKLFFLGEFDKLEHELTQQAKDRSLFQGFSTKMIYRKESKVSKNVKKGCRCVCVWKKSVKPESLLKMCENWMSGGGGVNIKDPVP